HFIFHDKEYSLQEPAKIDMDVKIASIRRDSVDVPLTNVQKGDEATAVSYAEAFKNMQPRQGEQGKNLIARFPNPAPVDEVYLKRKDAAKPDEKPQAAKQEQQVSAKDVLLTSLAVLAALVLLILLTPYLIFHFFKWRYKTSKAEGNKAYWAYRTAGFYLHQIGIYRGTRTPMQYARDVVDPPLGTSFVSFMNIYLKKKYAKQSLTVSEQQYVTGFLEPFLAQVRKRIPFSRRLKGFLNPSRSITFFVKPDDKQNDEG
ncbi:MAG: hypothetical protein K0R82_919, partial [Flavipsychrobacter sp.]|nr:hypothetical protein [Flavipsychrobacter sp.]